MEENLLGSQATDGGRLSHSRDFRHYVIAEGLHLQAFPALPVCFIQSSRALHRRFTFALTHFFSIMPVVPVLKSLVPLAVGVGVGIVGATMFRESLPGEKGSPEERAAQLEVKLKKAENRIAALEEGHRPHGRTMKDGLRDIADDIRAGRPVTPDDVAKLFKPLMRDLEPLMSRMRVREENRRIESMTGELARKYDLTGPQQE